MSLTISQRKLAHCYSLIENPRLVQRVQWRDEERTGATGVDRYFGFDYMGSAEFEFGSLPSALEFMREDVAQWAKEPLKIEVGKHVAWYVGPQESQERARKFFTWQLNKNERYKGQYLQERTQILDSYEPENEHMADWYGRIIGWWAIDAAPCPWAFFKKKEYAERWLKCLQEKQDG